jgi:hypothetical protein
MTRSLRPMSRPTRPLLLAALALLVVACSTPTVTLTPGMSHEMSPAASLGPRPSSFATVEFVEPKPGATVEGAAVHVVLRLNGAVIVADTTTSIRPDEGHVHLYVNNQLVSMNYGLEQDVPVNPGTIVIKAEFVAADHAPFSPRVWSDEIVVTIRA